MKIFLRIVTFFRLLESKMGHGSADSNERVVIISYVSCLVNRTINDDLELPVTLSGRIAKSAKLSVLYTETNNP